MEGWQRVASEQDWLRIIEESREAYESGGFLLERLGAQRYLDPKLTATILSLRQTASLRADRPIERGVGVITTRFPPLWRIANLAARMLQKLWAFSRSGQGRIRQSEDAMTSEKFASLPKSFAGNPLGSQNGRCVSVRPGRDRHRCVASSRDVARACERYAVGRDVE
jgi:hypothetical protein